jgi:hypothetical protein
MSDFSEQSETTGTPPPETGTSVDTPDTEKKPLTEALFREEAEKIWDRAEARSAKDDTQRMIPTASKNLTEAFDAYAAWTDKSPEQQESLRDAHDLVSRVKANAAAMGLTISDEAALDKAMHIEEQQSAVPPELQPALQAVQQTYPDMAPHEAVGRYVEMDRLVRQNPVEAVSQILRNTGHNEVEVLRAMALRHNPQEIQQSFALSKAETVVDTFFQLNPDAAKYEAEITAAIKPTGNYAGDLQKAYAKVKGDRRSGRSGGRSRSLESEMADILNAKEAREAARR